MYRPTHLCAQCLVLLYTLTTINRQFIFITRKRKQIYSFICRILEACALPTLYLTKPQLTDMSNVLFLFSVKTVAGQMFGNGYISFCNFKQTAELDLTKRHRHYLHGRFANFTRFTILQVFLAFSDQLCT